MRSTHALVPSGRSGLSRKYDWLGALIGELRRQGADAAAHRFHLGEIDCTRSTVAWRSVDHVEFDGVGAVLSTLRDRAGEDVVAPRYAGAVPSLLARARLGFRFLSRSRPVATDWARAPTAAVAPAPAVPQWTVFEPQQTNLMRAQAQTRGVSLNSLLFAALHEAIGKPLLAEGGAGHWGMPINMRGAVTLPRDTANHVTMVSIRLDTTSSPETVHAAIKEKLQAQEDWAYWWVLNLPAILGKAMLRLIAKGPQSDVLGVFSNLGEWRVPVRESFALVFAPPIERSTPVAAGAVCVNGRLALALNFHPCLGFDEAAARARLAAWRATCLGAPSMSSAA